MRLKDRGLINPCIFSEPDVPSNLRQGVISAYWFILEWEEPTKVHGIITGYRVSGLRLINFINTCDFSKRSAFGNIQSFCEI